MGLYKTHFVMNRSGFRRRMRRRGPRGRRNRRLNIFSNVYDAKQTTCIRLCQSVSIASSGAGTVAALLYCDPFTQSFSEHTSDFANVFNQFRLLGSRIQLISTIETKGDVSVMAIGYQNRNSGLGVPTAVNNVLDNQPSQLWAVSNDTSSRGFTMKQKINGLLYAACSTTANTSSDSAGAPGGWQIYGAGFPASTVIVFAKFEVWLEYRSRS